MKKFILTALLSTLSIQSFALSPKEPVLSSEVNGIDISLTWSKIDDVAGYALYYTPAPYQGQEHIERMDLGSTNSFSIPLFMGADYLVAVKAYNTNQEESEFSNIEQVTVSQFQMVYMGLSRQRYNGIETKDGVFQMLVDQQTNFSSLELISPDNSSYGQFTIKDDKQAEIFIEGELASMENYLLTGEYKIGSEAGNTPLMVIKSGTYPPFPEIASPMHDATDVDVNPVINYTAMSPANISITEIESNKEVFFSIVEADGSKSIKIDTINLKPKTRYLLEINSIKEAVAKGSTSAIAFTTKERARNNFPK